MKMGFAAHQVGYLQMARGSVPLLPSISANAPVVSVTSAAFEASRSVPVAVANPLPVRTPGWALPPVASHIADAVGLAAGAGIAIYHGTGEAAHHGALAVQRAGVGSIGIALLVTLAAREGIGWLSRRGAQSKRADRASAEELLILAKVRDSRLRYESSPRAVQLTINAYMQAAEAYKRVGKHLVAAELYCNEILVLQQRSDRCFNRIKPVIMWYRAAKIFLREGDFERAEREIFSAWDRVRYDMKNCPWNIGMGMVGLEVWRLYREIHHKTCLWYHTNKGNSPRVLVAHLIEQGFFEQAAEVWLRWADPARAEKVFHKSLEAAGLAADTLRREKFGESARIAERIGREYYAGEAFTKAAEMKALARSAREQAEEIQTTHVQEAAGVVLDPEVEAVRHLLAEQFEDALALLEAAQTRGDFRSAAHIATSIANAYFKRRQSREGIAMRRQADLLYKQAPRLPISGQ